MLEGLLRDDHLLRRVAGLRQSFAGPRTQYALRPLLGIVHQSILHAEEAVDLDLHLTERRDVEVDHVHDAAVAADLLTGNGAVTASRRSETSNDNRSRRNDLYAGRIGTRGEARLQVREQASFGQVGCSAHVGDVRSGDHLLSTGELGSDGGAARDEGLRGANQGVLQIALDLLGRLVELVRHFLSAAIGGRRLNGVSKHDGFGHDLRDVVAHHGRVDGDVRRIGTLNLGVHRDGAQRIFLPLEQRLVNFLGADVRLERRRGRGQVGDDVRDVFLEADFLVGLVGSDGMFLRGASVVGCLVAVGTKANHEGVHCSLVRARLSQIGDSLVTGTHG